MERWLESKEGEGFDWSGSEGTGDSLDSCILDDLEFLQEALFGGVRTIPRLTSIGKDWNNACLEEQAEVDLVHSRDSVAQTSKTQHDVGTPRAHNPHMILEGEFPIQVETEPLYVLRRGDGDSGVIDGSMKGGRGVVVLSP